MKIKSMSLVLAGLILGACAGDKNGVQANGDVETAGAVLAVRTIESGEITEAALLSGNFDTPEAAKAAVESAQWVPIAQFVQDEELDFIDASSAGLISDADQERNFGSGNGSQNRGDNGFRGGDGNRGDNGFRGGDDRNNHAGNHNRHDGRRFSHHRPAQNWRPHYYNNHWNSRPWHRPSHQYWNYNRCNYRYIWYGGRCVLPRSRAYGNYHWQPQYGYTYRPNGGQVNVVSSNWYVRIYF